MAGSKGFIITTFEMGGEAMQDEDLPPSKTQRKNEMHALQTIGEQLVELNTDRLKQLDLPESLLDAVREAKRITSHGGLRRQMQYIGKLMRHVDAGPIQAKFDAWAGVSNQEKALFHSMERWRTRLLEEDSALQEFLGKHPEADVQHLRTLIRNAHKEAAAGKPPKSSRVLFQEIRTLIQAESPPESEHESPQNEDGSEPDL